MRWLPFSRKHDATRRPKAARRCSPPLSLSNTQLPSAALLLMATPNLTDDPSSVSIHPPVSIVVLTRPEGAKEKQLEGEPTKSQSLEGGPPQNIVTNHSYDQNHPPGAPSATTNGAAGAPSERPATEGATGPGQASAVLAPPHAPTPSQSSHPTTSRSGTDAAELKDPEKDKGSLDTTLNTRTPSIRRKDAKSASEGTHTMSPEQPGSPQTRSKRARQSLFVKLFHVLVPCVGPSQRRLQDELYAPGQQPKATASTSALKEKQAAKEAEELPPPPPPSEEPTAGLASEQPVQLTQPEVFSPQESTPTLKPLTIPTQAEQQEQEQVVIPPSPTRSLLPPDETEGMTSGAVQPPGSTGEESPHDHIHGQGRESGTESDGSTSFTEDEDLEDQGPLDDIEDEEERLIMNGGAGIPIGPVRSQDSVFFNCPD